MSSPYVGEIRMFGGNFAPAGWMFCEGQVLPIDQYTTLFNLIGTTYGGDGQSTFQLPDLRGRAPVHQGNGDTLAETGGVETVTLSVGQIPNHAHTPLASVAAATSTNPAGATWAAVSTAAFTTATPDADLAPGALASTGGSQPHENRVPSLAVSFIISLFGIFPSQT
jgi:microcystin-dependent protein